MADDAHMRVEFYQNLRRRLDLRPADVIFAEQNLTLEIGDRHRVVVIT